MNGTDSAATAPSYPIRSQNRDLPIGPPEPPQRWRLGLQVNGPALLKWVKRSADHRYAARASPCIPEGCQRRRGGEEFGLDLRRACAECCSSGTPPACGNHWGPPCPVVSLRSTTGYLLGTLRVQDAACDRRGQEAGRGKAGRVWFRATCRLQPTPGLPPASAGGPRAATPNQRAGFSRAFRSEVSTEPRSRVGECLKTL